MGWLSDVLEKWPLLVLWGAAIYWYGTLRTGTMRKHKNTRSEAARTDTHGIQRALQGNKAIPNRRRLPRR